MSTKPGGAYQTWHASGKWPPPSSSGDLRRSFDLLFSAAPPSVNYTGFSGYLRQRNVGQEKSTYSAKGKDNFERVRHDFVYSIPALHTTTAIVRSYASAGSPLRFLAAELGNP